MTPAPAARGRFITFEGGEGAGKSTQIQILAAALVKGHIPVRVTREPGGVESAERIRALLVEGAVDDWRPTTELLLHYAARVEHVERLIRPALGAGEWVLCDRFSDSTMAYQGYGHALDRLIIEAVHRHVLGEFRPDFTLVLDVPIDDGLKRSAARKTDGTRYEKMDAAFHERVRQGFLQIAEAEPGRCMVFDARRAPDRIANDIRQAVARRFQLQLPA